MTQYQKFEDLLGKTLTAVTGAVGDDALTFSADDGDYQLYYEPDCCASCYVEDICGDLADLVGSPIVQAEESSSNDNPEGVTPPESYQDSFTWTFYRIATAKGLVVIRWYGSSNGYYSESVSFRKLGD